MKNSLLLALLLCSTHALSANYKWVDENNQTHYSEQPPPGKKAKVIPSMSRSIVNPSASGVPAIKTAVERASEISKAKQPTKEATEKAAQKQAYEDALKVNCESAKKNLAALNDGIRLVEIDANGERSFLSDEQRQQRTAKAQQDIRENCK